MFALGLVIAFVTLLLDQLSKWAILRFFESNPPPIYVNDYFNLVMVWNKGISFGMFRNFEHSQLVFSVLSISISVFLIFWLRKCEHRMLSIAIGLIIGGAIGNVVDRFRFGAVADFLDFHVRSWHWPAFNVADSTVCVGAFLLCIYSFLFYNPPPDVKN